MARGRKGFRQNAALLVDEIERHGRFCGKRNEGRRERPGWLMLSLRLLVTSSAGFVALVRPMAATANPVLFVHAHPPRALLFVLLFSLLFLFLPGCRHHAVAGPQPDPPMRQVRPVHEGQAGVLPPRDRVQHVPAVHVPPSPLPVPAGQSKASRAAHARTARCRKGSLSRLMSGRHIIHGVE